MSTPDENTGEPAITSAVDGHMPTIIPPHERGDAWGKAGTSWAIFEFARNPYYLLVIIYVFAPYLSRDVVAANALADGLFDHLSPDEAKKAALAHGQAFVAGVTKWAGAAAALSAPILGAALDRGPKRKPLVAVFLAIIVFVAPTLWWVQPGEEGISLFWTGLILIVCSVAFTYSEVIHNSMLPDAGRPEVLPRISGHGLALGNLAGTILMIAIVMLFALPAMMQFPFKQPLFGLDVSKYEHFRLAGPLAAAWLAIMIWPFFLYCPDAGKKGASWIKATREGLRGIINTLKKAMHFKEVMKYLFARMIYADGMSALLALGAVYVAGALDWSIVELVGYAIWLSIFATIGGFFGAFMDRVLGTRNALLVELICLTVILFFLISITQDSIFFGLVESYQVNNWPVYSHLHDWAYLGVASFLGAFATACISSSRSMLVSMAPKEMIGEFFGLYAIAGTVTVWLGPLLVEVFTKRFNSQQIGMSTISVLFVFGFIMLLTVKHKKGQH